MAKSLTEKFSKKDDGVEFIVITEKSFWGQPAGSKMYISSPEEVAAEVSKLKPGQLISIKDLRAKIATKHGADFACPLTTSIFLRIAIDYWLEDTKRLGGNFPFWRTIDIKEDKLFKKLNAEQQELIIKKQAEES